jgi:YtxH-like protein
MWMKKWSRWELDDILRLANLQRRCSTFQSVAPALGFVALGTALGVGVGLMLAPSSGRRLRQDVADRMGQLRNRMNTEQGREMNDLGSHGQQG